MRLESHNEWDRLETVVVGSIDGFAPGLEAAHRGDDESFERAEAIAKRAYPRWYLDEVAEDLDGLSTILRNAGISVLRPRWTETSPRFSTPNWSASGFDIYNVRDLHVVFGNTLVAAAPSSRFRLFESYALHDLLYDHFFDDGFRWISAPLPRLRGDYLHPIERPRSDLERSEDSLHRELSHGISETFHRLDEDEVVFDAANIVRADRDIVFLVSSTGNRKAARWLRNVLGDDYRVHATDAYRSSHLDSTILPLRRGVVLLNGARVSADTVPECFAGWEQIFFTDVAPLPEVETAFHRAQRLPIYHELRSLGVESTLNHVSSPWAGLNVLSIDPRTVLVHDRQAALISTLEARGFTVVPVRMRHCYTMLGGLHCTTLDVARSAAQ